MMLSTWVYETLFGLNTQKLNLAKYFENNFGFLDQETNRRLKLSRWEKNHSKKAASGARVPQSVFDFSLQ